MKLLKLENHSAFVAGITVIIIALVLYVATLDNGLRLEELKGGDLITHQYAQAQARPSNAPGYPLYTMLGWLWFHLGMVLLRPFFNPIEILSLYSTIWALAALVTLYVLILETTEGNWPVAALCTLFFTVTYFFWYYSVSTEQYTSAVFQTLLIVLFAFRWERSGQDKYLLLLALMVGLVLANLITVLLILPPLVIFILSRQPRLLRRPKVMAKSLLLALLPLLSYVYVYVRGAQHPEWRGAGQWPTAWAWFLSFIGTRQGWDELTWNLGPFTAEFPWRIFWEMTPVGLIVASAGIWLLGKRQALFLYGTFALYFAFSYIDRHGNWYQVIMPVYPLLVLGIAVLADRLWRTGREGANSWSRGVVLLGLVTLIVGRLATYDPRILQHNRPEDDALLPGRAILADDPAPQAAIVGDHDEYLSLGYLTRIWGARPDVQAIYPEDAPAVLERGERPLYVTRQAAPLVLERWLADVHLSGQGLNLIAVRSEPQMAAPAPTETQPVGQDLGGRLRLLGYAWEAKSVDSFQATNATKLHLTFYWQALTRMDYDYAVSVRPTLESQFIFVAGALLQADNPHPVWGHYPTSRWAAGEVVRDDYLILLPPGQPYDGVAVVVYRPLDGSFEDLGMVVLSFDESTLSIP
jgi:hypothetical protein